MEGYSFLTDKQNADAQNRLTSMNEYLKKMGPQNPQTPKLWVGGGQKKVVIPVDEGGGGKWVCTALKRSGAVSLSEFIWLTNGHAVAIFTNGDFVSWYSNNAGKLVENAELLGFNWNALTPLIDRMRVQLETEGLRSAIMTYIHLCASLYELFGKKDETIEPFETRFYSSSWSEKLRGTLKVVTGRLFWKQLPRFVRLRVVGA